MSNDKPLVIWPGSNFIRNGTERIPQQQLIFFTRQMADFLMAGVPVVTAMELLEKQTGHLPMRKLIGNIRLAIQDGQGCSQACGRYPDFFPPFYVSMLQAGEMTGLLGQSFERLSGYLEHEAQVRAQILTALLYPGLTLMVGVLTVVILLFTVVPCLTEIFYDFQQTLPWPTWALITASKILSRWGWLSLVGIAGGTFYFKRWVRQGEKRLLVDRAILQIPVFGRFLCEAMLAKCVRTLAILSEHGVSSVISLQIIAKMSGNHFLQKEFLSMAQQAAHGRSLVQLVTQSSLFPLGAGQMLVPSYESGQLAVGLQRLAAFLEKRTQSFINNFLALLEPLLILGIGAVIALIAVALLLPLWQINMIVR